MSKIQVLAQIPSHEFQDPGPGFLSQREEVGGFQKEGRVLEFRV